MGEVHSQSCSQMSWTGKLWLPEFVRRKDCAPLGLWSSENQPLSILDYGDQRSPPRHWPASAASSLTRSREITRAGRVGGRKEEPDSQIVIWNKISHVFLYEMNPNSCVCSRLKKWHWAVEMPSRCQHGNERWCWSFMSRVFVSDKNVYQQVDQRCVAPIISHRLCE